MGEVKEYSNKAFEKARRFEFMMGWLIIVGSYSALVSVVSWSCVGAALLYLYIAEKVGG